jgi:hypothetical protein
MYFLFHRRHAAFLVFMGAAFLIKEEILLIAIAIGLYAFFFHNAKRLGLGLALSSVLLIAVLLLYVMPFFRESAPGTFYYLQRYGYLGRTLPEILDTVIHHPEIVAAHVLIPERDRAAHSCAASRE